MKERLESMERELEFAATMKERYDRREEQINGSVFCSNVPAHQPPSLSGNYPCPKPFASSSQ